MKHDLASLKAALTRAPATVIDTTLIRRVEYLALIKYTPANWLYTSGRANRYNPPGVHCVYFGTDSAVVRSEYEEMWKGLEGEHQPATEYKASVKLHRVLDLTDPATLTWLGVTEDDLFAPWRFSKDATVTQLIGLAVYETGLFSAIRYPSNAIHDLEKAGANVVIFRDCVKAPDSVLILGNALDPLQKWP